MIHIRRGVAPQHLDPAARLLWAAFARKLRLPLGDADRAAAFLSRAIRPGHALSAVDRNGHLVGVAGFRTAQGGFVGGGLADLAAVYGPAGALWRGLALWLLERECEPGVLTLDGLCVDAALRGGGIGTALLAALRDEARARGMAELRLDVIDGNRRARALYERAGFRAAGHRRMGVAGHLFGVGGVTAMRAPVGPGAG